MHVALSELPDGNVDREAGKAHQNRGPERNPPKHGSHTSDSTAWEVIIQQPQPQYFTKPFLSAGPTVSSRAGAIPGSGIACILALDPTAQDAVIVSGNATVNISTCDVYDNSDHASKALEVSGGSATLDAKDAYIVGEYCAGACSGGSTLSVTGTLKTGATAVTDPYANRTAPSVGACGVNPTAGGGNTGNYTSPSTATTINPGVYCGDIDAGGQLTLNPGVYIIKGGNFKDQGGHGTLSSGVCTGTGPWINATGGVTIYMIPNGSTTGNIQVSACLSITAPTTGATAGMAFWVDKSEKSLDKDAFSGGSNVAITGAIYAPVHEVDYTGSSSATSSCTQIVADKIDFTGSANFQHNCAGLGLSDPAVGASKLVL